MKFINRICFSINQLKYRLVFNVISQLKSFNLENDDSKFEENLLNVIKKPKLEIDASTFYNVIISIQSIKDILLKDGILNLVKILKKTIEIL